VRPLARARVAAWRFINRAALLCRGRAGALAAPRRCSLPGPGYLYATPSSTPAALQRPVATVVARGCLENRKGKEGAINKAAEAVAFSSACWAI